MAPVEAAERAAENPAFPEPIMRMEGCSSDVAIRVDVCVVRIRETNVYELITSLVEEIRCRVGFDERIHAAELG